MKERSVEASYLYLAKYGYTDEVLDNNNLLRLFPYQGDGQTLGHSQFLSIPAGRDVSFVDGYNNVVRRSIVDFPHFGLVLATAGRVMLHPRDEPRDIALGDALSRQFYIPEFLTPSPLVDPYTVGDCAREIIADEQTLLGAVRAIVSWVHENITYERGYTTVVTSASEVLEYRTGVCQDFAHLTLGLMRAVWIPCRYVSGLLTDQIGETHAWVEFWHAEEGWVACDPTHNKPWVTGPDHVKFAVGRDYTDVPPVQGEFTTRGSGYLDKIVAEARLERSLQSIEDAISMVLSGANGT